jgi:CheY-like chemotaxis protein
MRILLVEDNEVNQLVASRILKKAGFIVTIANNGKEAVEKVTEDNYGLVLMDIQMPVMDGLEATREIRKLPDYQKLPIVAMTAHAMSGDRELSIKSGMNDHVNKPIDVQELFKTIAKWTKTEEEKPEEEPEPDADMEEDRDGDRDGDSGDGGEDSSRAAKEGAPLGSAAQSAQGTGAEKKCGGYGESKDRGRGLRGRGVSQGKEGVRGRSLRGDGKEREKFFCKRKANKNFTRKIYKINIQGKYTRKSKKSPPRLNH